MDESIGLRDSMADTQYSEFSTTGHSLTDSVVVQFVLNDGYTPETCPSIMLSAFQLCEERDLAAVWLEESSLLRQERAAKTDIFVFEPFEGPAFKHITELGSKCVVIGPRCLTYCLLHKQPLPDYSFPMHNMAMHNVVVTCTGLDGKEKEKVKTLVEYMAGLYCSNFTADVTHLIAGVVDTKKYRIAQQKELPVLRSSWVFAVWEAMGGNSSAITGSGEELKATDQQFLSHVCPVFLNQVVCVSQLPKKDKVAIKKLVEDNGGVYSASLDMKVTTLLVLMTAQGDKYRHAQEWQVTCVTQEYVYDSVQAGYALDTDNYKFKNRESSTPTKGGCMPPPDVSMCSTIANDTLLGNGGGAGGGGRVSHVNQTLGGETTMMLSRYSSSAGGSAATTNDKILSGVAALDQLSLCDAGKGGLFLDGCKVYLSGWAECGSAAGGRAEKLRKLLNMGGATRFNQLTDAVSHIIMGSFQGDTVSTVKCWVSKPHLVSAEWLVASAALGKAADEAPHICVQLNEDTPDPTTTTAGGGGGEGSFPPPPTGGIMSNAVAVKRRKETASANDTTVDFNLDRENDKNCGNVAGGGRRREDPLETDDLVKQYLKASTSAAAAGSRRVAGQAVDTTRNDSLDTSTILSSQSTLVPTFAGLSFLISGYEPAVLAELQDSMSRCGARVFTEDSYEPSSSLALDYCMLTVGGEGRVVPHALHYVSHIFVEDCSLKGVVLEVEYYHMPLLLPPLLSSKELPLAGVVLAMSTYTGYEREFLVALSTKLGAYLQETFARKDVPSKGVRRCTHLICPHNTGDKYRASVKWGVPALTGHWLVACASSGSRVSEEEYRAGQEGAAQQQQQQQGDQRQSVHLLRKLIDDHVARQQLATEVSINDSMIAPTPRLSKKVLSLRGQPADGEAAGGSLTTPGKPTTPSAVHTPDLETMRRLYPTPGRRVSSNDSLDAMPTPETPYGITWESNPSKRTRKAYKRVLDNMPENDYQRMVKRQKMLEEVVKDNNNKMTDNIKRVLGYDAVEEVEEEAEETKGAGEAATLSNTDAHGPLTGCVVYVPQKLDAMRKDVYNRVSNLGGEYRWSYDSSITHFIFQGKGNEHNKELKVAIAEGKVVVSPDWVTACYEQQAWLDESPYPYQYNPNMSLTVVSEKLSSPNKRPPSTIKQSKPETSNTRTKSKTNDDSDEEISFKSGPTSNVGVTADINKDATSSKAISAAVSKPGSGQEFEFEETGENSQVVRELAELEKLAAGSDTQTQNTDGEGGSGTAAAAPLMTPVGAVQLSRRQSLGWTTGGSAGRRRSGRGAQSSTDGAQHFVPPVNDMELGGSSQNTNIAWADPSDCEARRRLTSGGGSTTDLQHNVTPQGLDVTEPFETTDDDARTNNPADAVSDPRYVFVLSHIMDGDDQVASMIRSLGGSVEEDVSPTMTHLISNNPSRSERHLKAVAAGRWVLSSSYLEECEREGRFVEEAPHEWGNPCNDLLSTLSPNSMHYKMAQAAHRWRVTLDGRPGPRGAFVGWKALVMAAKDRTPPFNRLLQAGGASVETQGSLLELTVENVTCTCLAVPAADCRHCGPRSVSTMFLNNHNTSAAMRRRFSESNFPQGLTHCFLDLKHYPKFDLALFAKHKVPVIQTMFINDHLTNNTPPVPHDYCLPQYKQILSNLNGEGNKSYINKQ